VAAAVESTTTNVESSVVKGTTVRQVRVRVRPETTITVVGIRMEVETRSVIDPAVVMGMVRKMNYNVVAVFNVFWGVFFFFYFSLLLSGKQDRRKRRRSPSPRGGYERDGGYGGRHSGSSYDVYGGLSHIKKMEDPLNLDYLVSFRQFAEYTNYKSRDKLDEDEVRRRFGEYKEKFHIKLLNNFFEEHKSAEW
jgi:hypothetical protein